MCRAYGVIYPGCNGENKYVVQDPLIRQSGEQGLEAENYHQAKMKSYVSMLLYGTLLAQN